MHVAANGERAMKLPRDPRRPKTGERRPVRMAALLFDLRISAALLRAHHGDSRVSFSLMAAMAIGYLFYCYHGVIYGARFYFALLPYLVLATAEGVRQGCRRC
jgi:hypothetical protein